MDGLAVFFEDSGFEPFGDEVAKGGIIDALVKHSDHPGVVNPVEESSDVRFDDVVVFPEGKASGENSAGLPGRTAGTVSPAGFKKVLFVDGGEDVGGCHLQQFVFEHRDSQGPEFASGFGDHFPTHQFGPVSFAFEAINEPLEIVFEVACVLLAGDSVHSGGGTALESGKAGPEAVFIDQSVKVSEAGLRVFSGTIRYSPQ